LADVLAILYGGVMKVDPNNPHWEERDWLVLSKEHCAPALYAALALRGYFPISQMLLKERYQRNQIDYSIFN